MKTSIRWAPVGLIMLACSVHANPVDQARWQLECAESEYRTAAARAQQSAHDLNDARARLANLQREHRDLHGRREAFRHESAQIDREIASLQADLARAHEDERRAAADANRFSRDLQRVRDQIVRLRQSLLPELVGGLQLIEEIETRDRAQSRLEERARLIREDLPRWQPYATVLADVQRHQRELAELERAAYVDRYRLDCLRRLIESANAELRRMEEAALSRDVEAREARIWIESSNKRIERLQSGIEKQLQNHPEMIRASRDEQALLANLQHATRARDAACAVRDQLTAALTDAQHRRSQWPATLAGFDHRLNELSAAIHHQDARVCQLEQIAAELAAAERHARLRRDDAARHYERVLREYQSRPRYPTPGRPDSYDYNPQPPRRDDDRVRDRDQQDRPRATPTRPAPPRDEPQRPSAGRRDEPTPGRSGNDAPPPPRPAPRQRDR